MSSETSAYWILVVEDNPDIVIGLQDLLQHDGYAVSIAGTCADARAQIRARRFNAVLLDLQLPDGDGTEVLKEMQQLDASVPVVILTAHISPERTVGSLIKGAFGYLTKPYNREELRQTLRRAVGVKELAVKAERAEHLLIESEDRFRSLVESATDAIILADGHGTIVSWNRAASVLFGYAADEVIGRPLTILMPVRYRRGHQEGIARMESTGKSRVIGSVIELHGLRKDGMEFPIELSLATWKTSAGSFYSGIIRDISQRKQTEQALKQLEHQHTLILDQAGEGIYGLDLSGRTTFVNPSAAWMLGYQVAELLGQPMHEVVHHTHAGGGSYPREACPIYSAMQDGLVHRVDDDIFWKKDGTSFPVEYVSTPIHEGREIVGAVVVFRDMTERRQAQRAMEESQRRFRQLAEHINEVFWITDPTKNQIIYISPAYERIWMRSCESLYASPHSWLDAVHPEDRDRVRNAAFTKETLGTYDEEYRIVRPDGSVRWIWDRAYPVQDREGQVYRVVGLAEDITTKKEVEAALAESERKYRVLFDDNPSMYFMVNAEGTVLSVNRFGASRLGYRPDELIGRSVFGVFHEQDREAARDNLDACLSNPGQMMSWELRKIRKNGAMIWVKETAQAVQDEERRPVVLIVCEDISSMKKAERALRESEEFKNQIFRSSADCIKVLDLNGRILFMNEAGRDLLELDATTVVETMLWTDFWEGADRDAAVAALAAAKAGGTGTMIGSSPTRSGVRKWWDVRVTPVLGEGKRPVRLLAISRDITRHREYEEALRASEERLELVIHGSNDGFWDGRVLPDQPWYSPRTPVWYSPRIKSMLGYSDGEFPDVLESWASRLHPEDRGPVFEALRAHIEERKPYDMEYRLKTKQGDYHWVRARGQAVWDAGGRVVRMSGSLQSTMDRRRAEEAARRGEHLLRTLADNTTAVIYVKDVEGRFLLVNRRFEQLFRLSNEQIIGRTNHDIFPAAFADAFRANDLEVLTRKRTIEYEESAPHHDGPHTYLSIKFPLCDEAGEVYATCGISTDITERKRMEEALRTHEAQLRLALKAADVGIWNWDLLTGRLFWSSQVTRFFAMDRTGESLTVTDWLARVHPDERDEFAAALIRVKEQPGDDVLLGHHVLCQDGAARRVVWTGQIMRDRSRQAIHILGTFGTSDEQIDQESNVYSPWTGM
jgi:PAS domain S-box-containing protein